MEKKTQKKFVDESLGFPVVLVNAPFVKVRGQWALHINYSDYQKAALNLLANKPSRLTGQEIQFIRKFFEMTVRAFADRFSIRHSAVIKWEKKRNNPTKWSGLRKKIFDYLCWMSWTKNRPRCKNYIDH